MEGLLAILATGALTVIILVAVYREPERNAMDEVVTDHFNSRVEMVEGRKEPRMNIFQKARQGLNLTPGQRAFLKLLEALAVAFLVAATPVVADALSSHGTVVWADALRTALAAGAVAVILSVVKYLKAQGDSPVLSVVEGLGTSLADKLSAEYGLNEAAIEAGIAGDTSDDPPPDDGAPAESAQAA